MTIFRRFYDDSVATIWLKRKPCLPLAAGYTPAKRANSAL